MADRAPPAPGGEGPVLVAEGLGKAYGRRRALEGLSFALERGRVLGFLGPNGAGKTTAIRILTTVLEPSRGRFSVDGIPSDRPEEIRRRIGVLPENLGFPRHSTGLEYVTYFGQLYGLAADAAGERARQLLRLVGLGDRAAHPIGTYSHGMRQRLGIARALVNDPVVLFLDEPTLGLDPRGQQELLRLTRRLARERRAGVVLCSHVLSEIEGVCDDVVILDAGRVVAAGPLAEIVGRSRPDGPRVVRVRVPPAVVARAEEVLSAVPGVRGVARTDGSAEWLRVEVGEPGGAGGGPPDGGSPANEVLGALIGAGVPVVAAETEGGRLLDAFLRLTEEALT
ncbi:MAG TPA: ABC transporter ATP-binding protein [Actinomycetota bacterium]|nr:ABC transporter ATP-binding protein [Actinomycetota bacterium]